MGRVLALYEENTNPTSFISALPLELLEDVISYLLSSMWRQKNIEFKLLRTLSRPQRSEVVRIIKTPCMDVLTAWSDGRITEYCTRNGYEVMRTMRLEDTIVAVDYCEPDIVVLGFSRVYRISHSSFEVVAATDREYALPKRMNKLLAIGDTFIVIAATTSLLVLNKETLELVDRHERMGEFPWAACGPHLAFMSSSRITVLEVGTENRWSTNVRADGGVQSIELTDSGRQLLIVAPKRGVGGLNLSWLLFHKVPATHKWKFYSLIVPSLQSSEKNFVLLSDFVFHGGYMHSRKSGRTVSTLPVVPKDAVVVHDSIVLSQGGSSILSVYTIQ